MNAAALLVAMVLAPAGAGLSMLLLKLWLGRRGDGWFRWVGLATTGIVFATALSLFLAFDPTDTGFQFVTHSPWLPAWGIHFFLGLDGISLLLVLLVAFVFPVIVGATFRSQGRDPRYVLAMLVLETGLLGSFASLGLFGLQLFNWLAWLPAAALIAGLGRGAASRRVAAARRMLAFAFAASLLLLLAILALSSLHAQQFGVRSLDLVAAPGLPFPPLLEVQPGGVGDPFWQQPVWLFAALALAFAVQGPLLPFHLWLPGAEESAPTGTDALLGGVLVKLGIYGFLRVALPLFPGVSAQAAGWIAGLAVAGMLYAGALALLRRDLGGLVSSVSLVHIALPMLGVATLGLEGLEGSVLHLLSHGVAVTGLFLLIGMLAERRGVLELSEFGGIARPMPVYATLFLVVAASAMGLPPMAGFAGQLLVLLAGFEVWPWLTAGATLAVAVAALALLWGARRVLFGPVSNPANRGLIDLDARERLVLVALLIPIFWIGLHPATFLSRLEPSVGELRRVMEERRAALPEEELALPEDSTARWLP